MRSAAWRTAASTSPPLEVRWLGRIAYADALELQRRLVERRRAGDIPDQLILLEHDHVITLGTSAHAEHVLLEADERRLFGIEMFETGRGGQVTYHGPGQLVVYPLIDIRRAGLGVRDLVTALERAVIDYCASLGIEAATRPGAPGVYVQGRKLGSVGIRIRRGASYHGLALNVNMDLEPFQRINPCGYAGLQMTQLASLGQPDLTVARAGEAFAPFLQRHLADLRRKPEPRT